MQHSILNFTIFFYEMKAFIYEIRICYWSNF